MQSYERTYGSETSGTQPSHCKREASAVSASVLGDIVQVAPRQPHALALAAMASAEHKSAEPRMLLTRAAQIGSRTHRKTAYFRTRV